MTTGDRLVKALAVLLFLVLAVLPSLADQSEGSVFCPACGAELAVGARFCTHCGAELPVGAPSGEPEDAVSAPATSVPSAGPASEPKLEVEILPPVQPIEAIDIDAQLKAEVLFDQATALFGRGEYALAAGSFRKVVEKYPSTQCAEAARVMTEACFKMAAVDRGRLTRPSRVGSRSGDSALGEGFVGGCLGVGAAIALLAAIASAAN
ncbi:MAG: zinc-ribbon domain-containing protein [Candidatus Eisenbacteria bacterium]|jgi:hypothetical protein|nr:zinc-ribbon domain-containing protein [Candidatus Eisenbacteria bacterium]